ncbi:hypothetical protein [Streptomyces sp. NPDC058424]|uniref:hypothetical protein n=1 Tax=Streptomyces sp. NPDC058424 TaxID=3346491 RepID=UPI0036532D9D
MAGTARLTSYGLPSRRGRNSALMDLAAQMPPAVLSEVLGVSIGAATGWAAAGGPARGTPPNSAAARRAETRV